MKRTHDCGQLRSSDVGTDVSLVGWIDSSVTMVEPFIDLRDREGLTKLRLIRIAMMQFSIEPFMG